MERARSREIPCVASAAVPLATTENEFRALFAAQFTYVWNALRRLGVPAADREDLANEVFFRVHRALAAFDRSRPVRPWLFAFAFHVASDYRRWTQRRAEVALDGATPSLDPPADERLERAADRALVQAALVSVDLEKRAVFIMHELDEQPIPEIARALGLPEGTAYSRLRAARAQFAAAIQRERRKR